MSRLERLQEKADAKPAAVAAPKPFTRKEENKKILDEHRKADHYAYLALEDNVWYYRDRLNLPRGPCPLSTLRTCYINGIVDEKTLVWGQGLEEWVPFRNVRALPALVRNLETGVLHWWKNTMEGMLPKPTSTKTICRPKGSAPMKDPLELNGVKMAQGIPAMMTAAAMLNKGLFKSEPNANPIATMACMSLAFPVSVPSDRS